MNIFLLFPVMFIAVYSFIASCYALIKVIYFVGHRNLHVNLILPQLQVLNFFYCYIQFWHLQDLSFKWTLGTI